ncbi:zinc finger CCCH domain-containing protein 3-like isoform X1 [Raphanus sativus]|uniref:Zinc finger CCCH domain-containing protein 3-like isoform X1 n=1 Tax=Raphanus sativus TaxID=3726 RepID=A0A9W3CI60_RAPSA|nr:zinc finger CCCH domain-containing protein 3-like isoform X1 [Raphanus sativus]
MPSGKYYCDYCEKEFQDTQVARKRHLQSNPHLRAKSLWYSSSAPSDVNNPQVSSFVPRGLCNRFVSSGLCRTFARSEILADTYTLTTFQETQVGYTNNNNTQSLAGLPNQHIQGSSLNRDFFSGRGEGTGWFDLPPSLRPPPEQGYHPQLPSIDWG